MNGKSIFSHLKLDNSIASSPVTSVHKHYFVIMYLDLFFEICDNDDNASDDIHLVGEYYASLSE